MNLSADFNEFIKAENLFQKKDRLLLAVSGGVDSAVLVHLCHHAGFVCTIAHCNFQLRGEESERDEAFVKHIGKNYGIEVLTKKFNTQAIAVYEKKSIETAARDLRYAWFNELLNTGYDMAPKFIVTAHHADDNIETVTMNFFRGTGIAGLHGILPRQGKIIRPLLFARRSQIEQYAKNSGISYVTDSSNQKSDYTRNFFRNEVIPMIKKTFKETERNVLNNILRFRETEELFQQSVDLHKKRLIEYKGTEIHIPVLKLLKTTPLATVLYEITKTFHFTAHQTADVIALLQSESGKYVQSPTHRIIKNRQWLIITANNTAAAQHILIEAPGIINFEKGTVQVKITSAENHSIQSSPLMAQLNAAETKFPLLLRKWKKGDYFYPLGMTKKKKLSRFFVDQKLSLTQKENTWVIEMNKKIIWVVGIRIDERFKITANTTDVLLIKLIAGN